MSVITLTTQDSNVDNIILAAFKYQATINGLPNPEGKVNFMKRKLIEYISTVVKASQQPAVAKAAIDNNNLTVESTLVIT